MSSSFSSLSQSDKDEDIQVQLGETTVPTQISGEVFNVYVQPPESSAEFSKLDRWRFQPSDLSTEKRARYAKLIQDRIQKALLESVKDKCLIQTFLHPPGLPSSEEDMDRIKSDMTIAFNALKTPKTEPKTQCMVAMKKTPNQRVIKTYGGTGLYS